MQLNTSINSSLSTQFIVMSTNSNAMTDCYSVSPTHLLSGVIPCSARTKDHQTETSAQPTVLGKREPVKLLVR